MMYPPEYLSTRIHPVKCPPATPTCNRQSLQTRRSKNCLDPQYQCLSLAVFLSFSGYVVFGVLNET